MIQDVSPVLPNNSCSSNVRCRMMKTTTTGADMINASEPIWLHGWADPDAMIE